MTEAASGGTTPAAVPVEEPREEPEETSGTGTPEVTTTAPASEPAPATSPEATAVLTPAPAAPASPATPAAPAAPVAPATPTPTPTPPARTEVPEAREGDSQEVKRIMDILREIGVNNPDVIKVVRERFGTLARDEDRLNERYGKKLGKYFRWANETTIGRIFHGALKTGLGVKAVALSLSSFFAGPAGMLLAPATFVSGVLKASEGVGEVATAFTARKETKQVKEARKKIKDLTARISKGLTKSPRGELLTGTETEGAITFNYEALLGLLNEIKTAENELLENRIAKLKKQTKTNKLLSWGSKITAGAGAAVFGVPTGFQAFGGYKIGSMMFNPASGHATTFQFWKGWLFRYIQPDDIYKTQAGHLRTGWDELSNATQAAHHANEPLHAVTLAGGGSAHAIGTGSTAALSAKMMLIPGLALAVGALLGAYKLDKIKEKKLQEAIAGLEQEFTRVRQEQGDTRTQRQENIGPNPADDTTRTTRTTTGPRPTGEDDDSGGSERPAIIIGTTERTEAEKTIDQKMGLTDAEKTSLTELVSELKANYKNADELEKTKNEKLKPWISGYLTTERKDALTSADAKYFYRAIEAGGPDTYLEASKQGKKFNVTVDLPLQQEGDDETAWTGFSAVKADGNFARLELKSTALTLKIGDSFKIKSGKTIEFARVLAGKFVDGSFDDIKDKQLEIVGFAKQFDKEGKLTGDVYRKAYEFKTADGSISGYALRDDLERVAEKVAEEPPEVLETEFSDTSEAIALQEEEQTNISDVIRPILADKEVVASTDKRKVKAFEQAVSKLYDANPERKAKIEALKNGEYCRLKLPDTTIILDVGKTVRSGVVCFRVGTEGTTSPIFGATLNKPGGGEASETRFSAKWFDAKEKEADKRWKTFEYRNFKGLMAEKFKVGNILNIDLEYKNEDNPSGGYAYYYHESDYVYIKTPTLPDNLEINPEYLAAPGVVKAGVTVKIKVTSYDIDNRRAESEYAPTDGIIVEKPATSDSDPADDGTADKDPATGSGEDLVTKFAEMRPVLARIGYEDKGMLESVVDYRSALRAVNEGNEVVLYGQKQYIGITKDGDDYKRQTYDLTGSKMGEAKTLTSAWNDSFRQWGWAVKETPPPAPPVPPTPPKPESGEAVNVTEMIKEADLTRLRAYAKEIVNLDNIRDASVEQQGQATIACILAVDNSNRELIGQLRKMAQGEFLPVESGDPDFELSFGNGINEGEAYAGPTFIATRKSDGQQLRLVKDGSIGNAFWSDGDGVFHRFPPESPTPPPPGATPPPEGASRTEIVSGDVLQTKIKSIYSGPLGTGYNIEVAGAKDPGPVVLIPTLPNDLVILNQYQLGGGDDMLRPSDNTINIATIEYSEAEKCIKGSLMETPGIIEPRGIVFNEIRFGYDFEYAIVQYLNEDDPNEPTENGFARAIEKWCHDIVKYYRQDLASGRTISHQYSGENFNLVLNCESIDEITIHIAPTNGKPDFLLIASRIDGDNFSVKFEL